ncbi:MAG TPA: hypothetical protein VFQ61_37940 [Polyangiaceae bacterium]|nr:hypothetical protein [Polyangiaceae bacterium]
MRTLLLSCILSALALSCSSDRDAVEKRLAGLREDITRLQSQNDRLAERVEVLESRPAPVSAPQPTEPRAERPPLKIVRLYPGEASPTAGEPDASTELPVDERPDAPGNRPVIRLRGKQDASNDEPRDRTARRSATEQP